MQFYPTHSQKNREKKHYVTDLFEDLVVQPCEAIVFKTLALIIVYLRLLFQQLSFTFNTRVAYFCMRNVLAQWLAPILVLLITVVLTV